MYNLYISEKQNKFFEDKQRFEFQESKIKEKRKSILNPHLELINNLYNKYQTRIENFALDVQ